ncbi:ABC transporter permease subunit [Alkalispirochaeta alkalica]|uniref:ABC transporter permease subunit n=1 Tax=Alkalispirochaeta alkalica TaxID=46356 RepID=UPI00035FA0BC|nr:branched-chain amino acid ABC transporter permease [Alkalispirochaeta alkalica]
MTVNDIKKTALVSLWFVFLTFPIMVIRVNTITQTVVWRWHNMAYIGLGTFLGGLLWRFALSRRSLGVKPKVATGETPELSEALAGQGGWKEKLLLLTRTPSLRKGSLMAILAVAVIFPLVGSLYQTNIMISALIYVMLALGLNIVIGLGNMLHLGYIAFFAVGAYTYGLLHHYFGLGFWLALPLGALFSMGAGILLALPVLRLRGDYLAIVTLGFAEIVRIVLNNARDLTGGPAGISGIARPSFFGLTMNLSQVSTYIYYIVLAMVCLTIFVVWRFENSRLGRALVAMGEDEIAAEAMGIDIARTKLTAFALGSLWAGAAGVIFASRTAFINPASFTVWQSIIVLSCVVLGGMGSIPGVIVGALGLILIPEYLRAFADYRMLIFGAVLVVMMVFRPGGLIQKKRRAYTFHGEAQE